MDDERVQGMKCVRGMKVVLGLGAGKERCEGGRTVRRRCIYLISCTG